LGFAAEPSEALGVGCEGIGRHLERIIPVERAVVRPPDLARSALAEERAVTS